MATLRPAVGDRALTAKLDRWLLRRWDWVRPRTVPLLAAFAGLLLSLGIVKYTSQLSYDHDLATPRRALPALPRATHCWPRATHRHTVAPIQLPSPAQPGDDAELPELR